MRATNKNSDPGFLLPDSAETWTLSFVMRGLAAVPPSTTNSTLGAGPPHMTKVFSGKTVSAGNRSSREICLRNTGRRFRSKCANTGQLLTTALSPLRHSARPTARLLRAAEYRNSLVSNKSRCRSRFIRTGSIRGGGRRVSDTSPICRSSYRSRQIQSAMHGTTGQPRGSQISHSGSSSVWPK